MFKSVCLLSLCLSLALFSGCTFCGEAVDWVQGEQAADVKNPKKWDQHGISFTYAGNWEVDTEDEDFDAESFISVNSSGECVFIVSIHEGPLDPELATESFAKEMTALLMPAGPARTTPFKKWGQYEGVGNTYQGLLLIVPGTLRIFSHRKNLDSFTIVEQCFEEDMAKARPGFQLIEQSFQYHHPLP